MRGSEKILAHFNGGRFDQRKDIDGQLTLANEQCIVGMVETGEIDYDDLKRVGGMALAARIAKTITRRMEHDA